jgi:hypothetical protein
LPLVVAFVAGCMGSFGDGGAGDDNGGANGAHGGGGASARTGANAVSGGMNVPDNAPVIGASAGNQTHVISDGWETAAVPYGDNVKLLSYAQMQSEVERATGVVWPDWAANRVVFGGADYVTTFSDDRTPSGTKLLTWRKMAFDVCGTMIGAEAAKPSLFTAISPTVAISASDPKVAAQVKLVFARFFLENPAQADVDASTKALGDLIAAGGSPQDAWTGLCVGYLSSMRFLTY